MNFGGFVLSLVLLNLAFNSINGQFYVDIEHALPRIGKRLEENQLVDNDNLKETFQIERKMKHDEDSRRQLYSLAKTLHLLKLLSQRMDKEETTQK